MRMTVVGEIARFSDAEVTHGCFEFIRCQQFLQFRSRPAVKLSLVTFAVGVFGGVKTAVRMRHVAQDVIENVAGDGGVFCSFRRDDLRKSQTFSARSVRGLCNSPLRN